MVETFNTNKHFATFLKNLKVSSDVAENIMNRTHTITHIINKQYWKSESDKNHSLLVGSYGCGSAIVVSDIDLLVELPQDQKEKFDAHQNNGESALLQDVKSKLLEHYPDSDIKADGQIVSISFSDHIRFEILPAFKENSSDAYSFPNTHNSGSWDRTDPEAEARILTVANKKYSLLVKKMAKMMRAWNSENNVGLHGITIDSLIYTFFNNQSICFEGFDILSKDLFDWLENYLLTQSSVVALDDSYNIEIKDPESVRSKAHTAKKRCDCAIGSKDDQAAAESIWQQIFGDRFPIFASAEESSDKENNFDITPSVRSKRVDIGSAADTEEFPDEKWHINIRHWIVIDAEVETNGFRKGSILDFIKKYSRIPIKPRSKIFFSIHPSSTMGIVLDIEWFWKIRNVGATAIRKNCIRGQIKKYGTKHTEPIEFEGPHYVEVYGVSHGVVIAFGRAEVPLGTERIV
ncbi:hypothetical protein OENOO_63026 [Oenococcus oeni ATCC BAA-1163]|uniref:Adenylyl/Guanylyl and SMODS C-terminal sensor domain-containing protein n=1 Tax=Oenococcus oeni ATCC BAA-1163 TaxID=379360 RepID=A0NKE2_OENOE|nr:hypothetical protein OENOO_63026 [Oenococcus oeni ATCC BAA-1163]